MPSPSEMFLLRANQFFIRKKMKEIINYTAPTEPKTETLADLALSKLGLSTNGSKWKKLRRFVCHFNLWGEFDRLVSKKPKPYQTSKVKTNHIKVSGEFYSSKEWRIVRYKALKLHGGACQCCGANPTPGHPLHVDHIKPRSKFPKLGLELYNLQVLCEDCNLGKLAWDDTDWRKTKSTCPVESGRVLWDKDNWEEIEGDGK